MASNNHNPDGTFAAGNKAARGRNAKRVESWRRAFNAAVTQADVRAIAKQMVQQAQQGDTVAARIVLDRCLGPSEATDLLARLEDIEARLEDE